jgi:hypothetical protein
MSRSILLTIHSGNFLRVTENYACGWSGKLLVSVFTLFYLFKRKIIGGLAISLGGGPDHQVIGFEASHSELRQ